MVSPSIRRRAATSVVEAGLCSTRRACRYLSLGRSSLAYRPKPPSARAEQLRSALVRLSHAYPRYGYRRIQVMLEREGFRCSWRTVQRLRRQEDLCDPARPGQVREATIWSFQAVGTDRAAGPVWFEYRQNKSPKGPSDVLAKAGFAGLLQTDGASGLETMGDPTAIRHLACHAHARRYFFQAAQQGDPRAQTYVKHFDQLFALQRRLRKRSWPEPQPGELHPYDRAMERFGLPIWQRILALAAKDQGQTLPKSALGKALGYLLGRPDLLERCLTTPGAHLDNNLVENSVRPIKLGAKNWLFIGHPGAGPRLARLFALVENCRRHGVDPEAYLIDLLQRLEDHPARTVAELLPHRWAQTRAQEQSAPASAAASPI